MRTVRFAVISISVVASLGLAIIPAAAHPRVATLRGSQAGSPSALPASAASVGGAYLAAAAATLIAPRSTVALNASIDQVVAASGGPAAVTLIELGRTVPVVWSYDGSTVFTAASTYKLAALMLEAQNIAAGKTDPNGYVCYEDDDYESGWFDDYSDGECFTRNDLARRAGIYSDNTAGHMLVRDLGGADVLNAWAASLGAKRSLFFTDNTTTSDDLAALWVAEASGKLGGAAAQAWLYPMLTNTHTESGIPGGVGAGATVVHKTGSIDDFRNDAALVENGPHGAYVLTVLTNGLGDGAWPVIASISASAWAFETSG